MFVRLTAEPKNKQICNSGKVWHQIHSKWVQTNPHIVQYFLSRECIFMLLSFPLSELSFQTRLLLSVIFKTIALIKIVYSSLYGSLV
jgi:hypothetical protein